MLSASWIDWYLWCKRSRAQENGKDVLEHTVYHLGLKYPSNFFLALH